MSGGAYDHMHGRVDEFADLLERGIDWNGNRVTAKLPARSQELRLEFVNLLRRVAQAMEAIEMVDSHDASSPHDIDAIRAVLPAPAVVMEAERPRKVVSWTRDDDDAPAKADNNTMLEHALLVMANGYTLADYGKRRLTREELIELARGLCMRLGLSWQAPSQEVVDLRRMDLSRRSG